jgi:ATP-dependent Clp protease ATP-binding subunit ClpA
VSISLSKKAKGYIAQMGYDPEMGARPLLRVIQERIKDPLTQELLFGKLKDGGSVKVDYKKEIIFDISK